jgi:hypothetical protein
MSISTITLQKLSDYARTIPDIAPVLPVGGMAQQPALTIASRVMADMLAPGMNWKWNRLLLPPFYTNSNQQDYGVPGVVLVGWLEGGVLVDINNTSTPKPIWPLEAVREIQTTSWQWGRPGQVCWEQNNALRWFPWNANTTFYQIIGTPSNPGSGPNGIQDPNGNFWVISNNLNATVTTGSSQPSWPNPPTYPTFQSPSTVASVVNDGTAQWTALNPAGQGFRIYPRATQNGLFYQFLLLAQSRPPTFSTMAQTLDPVPDDFAPHFQEGFIAYCYQHSRDSNVRLRFKESWELWIQHLKEALTKGMREREEAGLYPSEGLLQGAWPGYIGPANPYYPGGY